MSDDQVTLRVTARPVRIISLVRNRDDIVRSVRLFTHLWGGAANAILPITGAGSQATPAFEDAVRTFDPDYIVIPPDGVPSDYESFLSSIPSYQDRLTDQAVREHVDGPNLLHFRRGTLAHMGVVLQRTLPTGFPETSNLRVLQSGSPHDFALGLTYGLPTNEYSTFLQRHLRARQINAPDSYVDLLKTLLIAGERSSARIMSLNNTRSNVSRNVFGVREPTPITSMRADREQTLFLFLDDGESVGLPCAFWNSRRIGPDSNKLFLPKELFLAALNDSIQTIRSVQPFDEVVVFAPVGGDESEVLRRRLADALETLGIEAPVAVYFRDYEFEVARGTVRIGSPEAMTRTADSERTVRFAPPAPFAREIGNTVFGYDAAVEYLDGRRLSLPANFWTSVLIQNPLERIMRAERNEQGAGRHWLHHGGAPAMRSVSGGIAGVTVPGEECFLYLHPDEVVIEQLLKEHNLRIKPNTHTRYVAGFARKFGGVPETLALVRQGGARIIRALYARRAEASGLLAQQVVGYLRQQYGMGQSEAKELVESRLPSLCATGLVRRGTSLTCSHCGLREWYPMSGLGEFMECAGCAQRFQLRGQALQYTYRANELSKRLIETGGQAVLMTAASLRRIGRSSGALQFGGDVFREGEANHFAELDLILLTADTLLVAECKDYEAMDESHVQEIISSLNRSMRAAVAMEADVLILGITSTSVHESLYSACQAFAETVDTLGLAVHIVLNGELHYGCAPEVTNEPALRLEHLKLQEPQTTVTNHSGTLRTGIGFGFSRSGNSEIIQGWETELGA